MNQIQKTEHLLGKRAKDIKGQRFGRLVVTEYNGLNRWSETLWVCRCDCGNTTIVTGKHLRSGAIQSCGCFLKERITATHFIDRTGNRFGRLEALRIALNDHGCYVWECRCDCGKMVNVKGAKLSNGHTKSCGCLCREAANKKHFKLLIRIQKGKNHPKWNPDLTDAERSRMPNNPRIKQWRGKVYERDCFTCQKCGDKKGHNLNAHHIYSWRTHPELRHVTRNGITFCEDCHKAFHKKYGYGKNTQRQLREFMMCRHQELKVAI